jgi:hypothetical protein
VVVSRGAMMIGEREILAGWEASTDWRFTFDERAGVAIGRRHRAAGAMNVNRDSA